MSILAVNGPLQTGHYYRFQRIRQCFDGLSRARFLLSVQTPGIGLPRTVFASSGANR